MHIFMAAVFTNSYMPGQGRYAKLTDEERHYITTYPNILESYHYIDSQRKVDEIRENKGRVFLDSGAFSAWTLGVKVDLPKYCDYVRTNYDILRFEEGTIMASVLDGIGDPLKTYQNQKEMEQLGAPPLPCFHFGEDERYLEYYVENYPYITIGGMVGKSKNDLRRWLDRIWQKYLTDKDGYPKLKVHGFGLTTVDLMIEYPWFSVDSSSWIQAAAFGSIIHPQFGALSISSKSPSRHQAGRHASTLTKIEQDVLFDSFERHGFNYERLSTVYESRAAFNIWSFGEVERKINTGKAAHFTPRVQELF